MKSLLAKDFLTGEAHEYTIHHGAFSDIRRVEEKSPEALPWIAPGLFDVQINGFGGVDFNNPISAAEWEKANAALARHGCTHFLATLITNSKENHEVLLSGLEKLRQSNPEGGCRGYHMEGPFLNPDPGTHGAHNTDWMRAPDGETLNQWRRICGENIRLITLAPEVDPSKSLPFIREAVSQGTRISLGHSLATGEILMRAIEAGAACWTHLGNAIGKPSDKFDNVLFHVLGENRILAFLIPDGIHIPSYAFRTMVNALGDRLLLTTDAMSAAAAAKGTYRICQHEIFVGNDHLARTQDGRLAGSTITPFDGVFQASKMTSQPWQKFWTAFSTAPARLLGMEHRLAQGMEASFCLLETTPDPKLKATYLKGKCVFSDEK